MTRALMLWRRMDVYVRAYLLIAVALIILFTWLVGCTCNITLAVSLPADTPATVSVEPQTKSDSFNL